VWRLALCITPPMWASPQKPSAGVVRIHAPCPLAGDGATETWPALKKGAARSSRRSLHR